jgi:hypothetical protein
MVDVENNSVLNLKTKLAASKADNTLFLQAADKIKTTDIGDGQAEVSQLQLRVIPVRPNVVLVNLINFTTQTDSKDVVSKDVLVAYYQKIPESESIEIKSSFRKLKAEQKELEKLAKEKEEKEANQEEDKQTEADASCKKQTDEDKSEVEKTENEQCSIES